MGYQRKHLIVSRVVKPGQHIVFNGDEYVVTQILDPEGSVRAAKVINGEPHWRCTRFIESQSYYTTNVFTENYELKAGEQHDDAGIFSDANYAGTSN